MTRVVRRRVADERVRRYAAGGRGACQRLLLATVSALTATMLALQLPWYYVQVPDGLAGGSRNPQTPLLLVVLAGLVLLCPRVVPAAYAVRQLVMACLAAATVCGFGAVQCLQTAGMHATLREPLGPAPWLGLIGFVASGTLALLTASALYQPARLNARQRKDLARAQERLAAAVPAWPDR